ncbi:MAG: ABC transporter permease [Paludibacteraceae bacterium]|nr:ABC transporter permease [Paludibacteraceae bacterium]
MKSFFYLLYKDALLLLRDKAGIILLFIMPIALVLIMTSMQDGLLNSITNTDISLVLLNDDNDSIGNTIEKELNKSEVFDVHNLNEMDTLLSENGLRNLVAQGKYLIGIYVPANTTQQFKEGFRKDIESVFDGSSTNKLESSDSIPIRIYLDPTIKPNVQSNLMSNVREFITQIQNQFQLKAFSEALKEIAGNTESNLDLRYSKKLIADEKISDKKEDVLFRPNSVQHNVPAWTLFAIFFIVISLSGSTIKEREDGSFNRLMTMPCSYSKYLLSKMTVYLFVCILQFLIVLAMGIWVFPYIGLESFDVNGIFLKLLFVVIVAACAAIGFGTAISSIATSQQQAAVFGSVSVVILAAIGGLWVPTYAMPEIFRTFSNVSPLKWGIDALYSIILRKSDISDVLAQCIYLLIFAISCFVIAIIYKKFKKV